MLRLGIATMSRLRSTAKPIAATIPATSGEAAAISKVSASKSTASTTASRSAHAFPRRGLFRFLEGKTNIDLRYRIQVPRKTQARICHGIGEVNVKGVAGPHDIPASIGQINLRLPTGVDSTSMPA